MSDSFFFHCAVARLHLVNININIAAIFSLTLAILHIFHTSVQHSVACVTEVTINTVYATLFIYPSLEVVLFIVTCFDSVKLSSGNIHMILQKIIMSTMDPLLLGLINFL
jgi:hypothetical protein